MKEIKDKIIEDLNWLAKKTDDPIVKIAYAIAITIVEDHFDTIQIN